MLRRIAWAALCVLVFSLLAWLVWHWRQWPDPVSHEATKNPDRPVDAPLSPIARDRPGAAAAAAVADSGPPRHPADIRCERDRRAQYSALYRATDPKASPGHAVLRMLLAFALDLSHRDRVAAQRELDDALGRWPKDVELAWLAYQGCGKDAGCDLDARLAHLQQVDADNLFAWLPSLTAAHQAGDDAAFAQAVHRAAQASLYDPRWGSVAVRLRPALQSMPLPAVCRASPGLRELAVTTGRPVDVALHADAHSLALEFAVATPAVTGVTHCWRSDSPLPDAVLRNCRRILARLAEGETMLERSIGLPGSIRMAPDAASREVWRARYRELRWLQALGPEIDRIDGFLWRTFAEGEIAVLERHARGTGRWPPPSDWLPDDEIGRELLSNDTAR